MSVHVAASINQAKETGPARILALGLAMLTAGLWLARGWDAPPPLPETVPAAEFSGERAGRELESLLAGVGPHPIGSPANRVVRDRIFRRLIDLGYEPEIQSGFVCSEFRQNCGRVENVVARRSGTTPGDSILLNSHYDSVPASPGAADDMSGVAILLEIARIRAASPPARNSLLFLFNDGEEAGLLGSTLFVRDHPAARSVRAVVNLEARGSGGASLLAEASGPAAGILRGYARFAPHPRLDSSVSSAVALLPNSNDLRAFRTLGAPGVMFGFVGGFRQYHSASDEPSRVDRGTLQHQGENATAVLRALENSDLRNVPAAMLSSVTLFGIALAWPEQAGKVGAIVAAALTLGLTLRRRRSGAVRLRTVGLAFGLVIGLVVLSAVAALAAGALIRAIGGTGTRWPSRLFPAYAAAWAAVTAITLIGAGLVRWRDAGRSCEDAIGIAGAAAALVSALLLPGVAPLFLLPTVFAIVARAIADFFGRVDPGVAPLVCFAFSLAVLLPRMQVFLDLGGLALLPLLGLFMGWTLLGLLPLAAGSGRRAVPIGAATALAGAALFGVASRVPSFTPQAPQFLSVVYSLDSRDGRARWIATGTPLPEPLRRAADFSGWGRPAPWLAAEEGATAPAMAIPVAPPRFARLSEGVLESGGRLVCGRVSSERGSRVVQIAFPAGSPIEEIRVDGHVVPPDAIERPIDTGGYRIVTIWTLPPEGVDVSVRIRSAGPVLAVLADRTFDLPAGGDRLTSARGDSAAANGNGDSTVVTTEIEL